MLVETLLAGLLSGLSSATVLIVGIVTGLFILLFLMKDWQLVTGATSGIGHATATAFLHCAEPGRLTG